MRKRMTSLLLTLVMLLSLVPAMGVTASAAATGDGSKGNPFGGTRIGRTGGRFRSVPGSPCRFAVSAG